MGKVLVSTSVDLASPAKDVWPLITDTDRVNRLIGAEPVTYRPARGDPESPARFVAETRAGGFHLEYEEHPFEWVHGRSFSVFREMRRGVLASYAMGLTLEPHPGGAGTRATFRLELTPSAWYLRPAVALAARKFVHASADLARAIDVHLRSGGPSPYTRPVTAPNAALVEAALRNLADAGVPREIVEQLGAYVRRAPDADLVRIRPFDVADNWGMDRRDVLCAFLRAVPAGLVELRWSLVCPSCRVPSEGVSALDEISAEGHCPACDVSFDLDLDRAVEATFVVHPAVRQVPPQMFCMGGPARTPHVLVQSNVFAGDARSLEAPDEPGRFRVFARGGASTDLEVSPDAPAQVDVSLADGALRPALVRVAPRGAVRVTNETGEARHVKIERLGYAAQAATAHIVSTLGEFRTLFSSDLLKRGTPLKVARVAILFSDLTGSTALYSKVGDAAAFRLVDDHFDLLRATIGDHHGTVVKTMGDAVMAAFTDPSDCVEAAVEALQRFERFRTGREYGDAVGIKLGMYAGPCYVVTANRALDYFGQTVNVASRVQHLAQSGELIVEASVMDGLRAETRAWVEAGERFRATVKGVDAPLELVRVRFGEVGLLVSGARVRSAADPSGFSVQAPDRGENRGSRSG